MRFWEVRKLGIHFLDLYAMRSCCHRVLGLFQRSYPGRIACRRFIQGNTLTMQAAFPTQDAIREFSNSRSA